jgi:Putative MetA-pathway of phenol degradation
VLESIEVSLVCFSETELVPMNIRPLQPLILVASALWVAGAAFAQDLEPRSFSQTPTGMNFAVVALGFADGNLLFDQATTLENVTGELTSLAGAYVHTLDFFGVSAKASALLPVMWGDWKGRYQGEQAQTSRKGVADPQFEFAVNFLGAPALKMSEMRNFTQKWVVGASLKMTVPLGQYDPSKLINLGTNRWGFRPRIGVSYKSGPLSLEAIGSVWFFTANDDFYGGALLQQGPLWSTQYNAVYELPSRVWFGLGAGISRGGRSEVNGIASNSYQKNTRLGAMVSVPINFNNSIKVIYINGLKTRIGSDLNQVTMMWSVLWGGM